MLKEVREGLANYAVEFPALDGRKIELAGLVWYQGWNDGVDPQKAIPEYEQNLVNFIHDVRKALNAPKLPVVIGELTGPWVDAPGRVEHAAKSASPCRGAPRVSGKCRICGNA